MKLRTTVRAATVSAMEDIEQALRHLRLVRPSFVVEHEGGVYNLCYAVGVERAIEAAESVRANMQRCLDEEESDG